MAVKKIQSFKVGKVMDKKMKAVQLLKTNRYTTYQFYGEMANRNTNVKDGLKYAILTTFEWLRKRLENTTLPEELNLPKIEDYKKIKDEMFVSFAINDSYQIQVVTDLKEGIWSLRINEPDSGQLGEEKKPVPGRSIQSDIGYRIVDGKLECGFKTTVYDSFEVKKADCIRFSLIRTLGYDPIFGFRQLVNLLDENKREIRDDASFENLKYLLNSSENELPILIYTDKIKELSHEEIRKQLGNIFSKPIIPIVQNTALVNSLNGEIEHLNKATSKYYGMARVFLLGSKYFSKASSLLNKANISQDEVIVAEPKKYGSSSKKYDHNDKSYTNVLYNYTREKNVDFHDVLFVSEALILIRNKEEEKNKEHVRQLEEKRSTIFKLQNRKEKEERLKQYKPLDDRDKEAMEEMQKTIDELEDEKSILSKENRRLENESARKSNYISFLERKLKWPKKHIDIVDWCKDYSYVEFNTKAVDCLKDNTAANVDVDVIMNALEYLEHAYALYLFEGISEDELQRIANDIYGRPYNVTPSGIPISARSDCKIRYSMNGEKKKEIPLDEHLKIGGHGDNLLRIYFIIDKNRKKIVIGSLPNHLVY